MKVSEKTEFPFYFSSDPLENYEKWCIASEGKYSVIDFEFPILCMFDSLEKREKSKEHLREVENTRIEGELSKRLCLAYKIDDSKCLDDIKINVEFDMETGYLLKDKKIDGVMYEFRIIEGQDIQYRKSMLNPLDWKDVEIDE